MPLICRKETSERPHHSLPFPRLKGGGIFDKREGWEGDEKWDLPYNVLNQTQELN